MFCLHIYECCLDLNVYSFYCWFWGIESKKTKFYVFDQIACIRLNDSLKPSEKIFGYNCWVWVRPLFDWCVCCIHIKSMYNIYLQYDDFYILSFRLGKLLTIIILHGWLEVLVYVWTALVAMQNIEWNIRKPKEAKKDESWESHTNNSST